MNFICLKAHDIPSCLGEEREKQTAYRIGQYLNGKKRLVSGDALLRLNIKARTDSTLIKQQIKEKTALLQQAV